MNSCAGRSAGQFAELEPREGEGLADLVVQGGGDAPPLALLGQRQLRGERAEALLVGLQLLLRAPAVGDVLEHPDSIEELVLSVADDLRGDAAEEERAVFSHIAPFGGVAGTQPGRHVGVRFEQRRPIVRECDVGDRLAQ